MNKLRFGFAFLCLTSAVSVASLTISSSNLSVTISEKEEGEIIGNRTCCASVCCPLPGGGTRCLEDCRSACASNEECQAAGTCDGSNPTGVKANCVRASR